MTPDNPSTANRQQLHQTLADLAVNPPSYLFFIGDMVGGYDLGAGELLRGQLQAWKELYEAGPLAHTSTIMVPLVGNHEVLASTQDPRTKLWTDFPNPATLPVWESVMDPYLKWSDGPTTAAPNLDELTHDQQRLTFTVRRGDVLFVCLNTDTFIDLKTIGDVPLQWIKAQLDQAEADPTIAHVFVMGHKPVLRPDLPGDIIRDPENVELDAMMGGHSKVRAYLTAHYHLWDCRRTTQGVLQVIAGNGGTNPSGQFNAHGKGYFGYTVVDLAGDGALTLENWGRPIPTPYDSDQPQPAARLLETLTISSP